MKDRDSTVKAIVSISFALVSVILIIISTVIDYRLTNDFLVKIGYDGLSLFQVMVLGSFTALMVGGVKHSDPVLDLLKKERRANMTAVEITSKMLEFSISYLLVHIAAILVYIYIIIPKFLS